MSSPKIVQPPLFLPSAQFNLMVNIFLNAVSWVITPPPNQIELEIHAVIAKVVHMTRMG